MKSACRIAGRSNFSRSDSVARGVLVAGVAWMLLQGGAAVAGEIATADSWAVLTGYGQSFPGWGQTTQRVETIDFAPRYNHVVFDDLGSGWYQGYHSTLIEVPVHFVLSPDVSAMLGVNFLACYTFTADDRIHPYLFGGGGPVYNFADIPGMGADLNGNYQFGFGLDYRIMGGRSYLFEFRYHHISNAGTADPNEPLNSCKLLFGVSF